MKWELLETAPIDGRQILVGFMGQFQWYSFVADAAGLETGKHMPYHTPTHWTKIEPPKS